MEGKHKNALIGALLAVVFVMAVGYAAFAQLLTINGTASITSTWDVHFDPTLTTSNSVTAANSSDGSTSATGTIAYNDNTTPTVATLTATLVSPGDTVTFTVKPTNYGSLSAQAAAAAALQANDATTTVASGGQSASSAEGNITWTIVTATRNVLPGANGGSVTSSNQDTITVRATLTGEGAIAAQSSAVKIELNYVQVSGS